MSCIHYKFRSSLEYDTITFDGLAISLGDLKKAIMAQKKIAKVTDFDLQVTNAQTKEEYKDENTQIPKNSSVIIRRIPTGTRSKAQLAADRGDSYASGIPIKTKTEELHSAPMKQNKMIDLVNSNASEEDKLKVMMSQAGEDWQPTHYVKGRGRGYNPSGPLPPNYVCYRCGKPGHFIRNCPTNGVKRTIGIPRKFGEEAQAETTDEKETKKPEPTKILVPVPEVNTAKDRKVPSELKCPMCQNLLNDAVLIPCCGTSYCDECIRTYLLENEQECPTCGAEDVSPDSLIINKQLRQAVNNFRNARPASPFVNSTTDKTSTGGTVADKPAVNSAENSSQNMPDKPSSSSPYINAASPDVMSPDTSVGDKDKSEEKVTSTTSEAPNKDVPELKKVEIKKEGSPMVLKENISSPRPDPTSDAEVRPPKPPIQPGGDHRVPLPAYGQHPVHRPPGPNMLHPISEPMIPRSIAPDGAIVVPAMRTARPIITPMHSAPIIQPGFIATTAPIGLRPMVAHPGMVHPALHMEPNLMGAGFPFGMKHGGLHPYGDGPPLSEEEFYRYQQKMKSKTKHKHRDKDRLRERDRGSRERSREGSRERSREQVRYKPKTHPADFDDELSQYRAIQRHRSGNYRSRSRSHSQSRSHSRSVSRSPSHSSRSRTKSPTPEDWDRSRTPSPSPQPAASNNKNSTEDDKKHKHKKRKKHHKHKHTKKRKTEDNVDGDSTTKDTKDETSGTDKLEKKKSKSKKKSKEKSGKSEKKVKLDNGANDNDIKMEEDRIEKNNKEEEKTESKKAQHKESEKIEVEHKEKSEESEEQMADKENGQNGTESNIKKTRKKSEEKSKHKSKDKSGEKKHKKKKKRKHKKHKKEKEKATSQSTEDKSADSTEETQESDEEKDEQ